MVVFGLPACYVPCTSSVFLGVLFNNADNCQSCVVSAIGGVSVEY